ncbi:MAG: hypothetical protein HYY09_05895 [Firmicutes bacterium]|nr:hypothetical protein [Bacillota bacterium]
MTTSFAVSLIGWIAVTSFGLFVIFLEVSEGLGRIRCALLAGKRSGCPYRWIATGVAGGVVWITVMALTWAFGWVPDGILTSP